MEDYIASMKWLRDAHVQNHSDASVRYNVPPGTYRPVLHCDGQTLLIDDLFWGYQAAWAVGKVNVSSNARLDKLAGGYWKPLLKSGRALVIADSWFEWTGEKPHKQPWRIYRKDGEPILMTAIARFGQVVRDIPATAGFAIITDDAQGGMLDIHDRRPVVLSVDDAQRWLDPSLPTEEAVHLLRTQAAAAEEFAWFQIDKAVGSVRNDGPELMTPIIAP